MDIVFPIVIAFILLLAVLLIRDVYRRISRDPKAGYQKCEFCSEMIKLEATVCEHCHKTVTPALPATN